MEQIVTSLSFYADDPLKISHYDEGSTSRLITLSPSNRYHPLTPAHARAVP